MWLKAPKIKAQDVGLYSDNLRAELESFCAQNQKQTLLSALKMLHRVAGLTGTRCG